MSEVQPTSPRDLRELLDAPLDFLRQHGRSLLPVMVAGPLLAAIPLNVGPLITTLASFGGTTTQLAGVMAGAIATYATAFLATVIYALNELAVLAAIRGIREGRVLTVKEAWQTGVTANLVIALLVKGALTYIAALACVLPIFYAMLVLIPFVPMMAMSPPEPMVVRGKEVMRPLDPMKALQRCFAWVHHKPDLTRPGATSMTTWTRLIVVLHAMAFVALPIMTLANLPTGIASGIFAFRKIASGINPEDIGALSFTLPVYINLPLSLLAAVGNSMASAYQLLVGVAVYEDLRDSVTGQDIEAALDARGVAP